MFGILGEIKQFFATVMSLGSWLILGAALAFLGAMFRNWVGYAGVAVGGAVIMFFALTGQWLGDDSKKIAQLEAENRAKAAKIEEIAATNAVLTEHLEDSREVDAENRDKIARLNAKIDAVEDIPECALPEGFVDDLDDLR